jgi:hypothetical protein
MIGDSQRIPGTLEEFLWQPPLSENRLSPRTRLKLLSYFLGILMKVGFKEKQDLMEFSRTFFLKTPSSTDGHLRET